jgi:cyclopropane-fatty-acyl-phospholipid synthase
MRLICEKLHIHQRVSILDIGCGFGTLLAYAAKHYNVAGVGVTVSKEQAEYANALFKNCGVEKSVSVNVQDYRTCMNSQHFDRIVSVGMFKHVGPKYYRTYFDTIRSYLKKDGLFLLHTIGGHVSHPTTDPWIDKYIFLGGVIPSYEQMTRGFQGRFVVEDWHNMGSHYDTTLMVWYNNLLPCWDQLIATGKYNERFRRMWEYYLLSPPYP